MAAQQLASQIAGLQRKLARMQLSPNSAPTPRRSRAQPRRRREVVAPQTIAAPPVPARRNRRRAGFGAGPSDATVRITKTELLVSVTKSEAASFHIQSTNIPTLKRLSKIYERVKFHSLRIFWKPAVGTTESGMVTYGLDWDFHGLVSERAFIAQYSPSASHAVWCDTTQRPMVAPASRLQSRAWYRNNNADTVDAAVCDLVYKSDHQRGGGEFWITYSCTLQGISPD